MVKKKSGARFQVRNKIEQGSAPSLGVRESKEVRLR